MRKGTTTTVVVASAILLGAAVGAVPASAVGAASASVPSVGVGSNPIDVVVSAKNGEAYVLNDGSVSVVDTATHQEVDEVGTGEFTNQDSLALGRGDSRAYITNPQLPYVLSWKTASRSNSSQVRIGLGGTQLAVGGKGKRQRAYVARLQVHKVATFRTHGAPRVQQLKVPGIPDAVAVAPDGRVWVADSEVSKIWVIGRAGKKIKQTIRVSDEIGSAQAMAFSPDGSSVWLLGAGGLLEVDVATHMSLGFLELPKIFGKNAAANPTTLAFSPSGKSLLVQNGTFPDAVPPQIATVVAVKAATMRVTKKWKLGHQKFGMTVDDSSRTAYAPNYADDTLSFFRTPR